MNKAFGNMPATIQIDGSDKAKVVVRFYELPCPSMITGQAFELINIQAGRKTWLDASASGLCTSFTANQSGTYVEGETA